MTGAADLGTVAPVRGLGKAARTVLALLATVGLAAAGCGGDEAEQQQAAPKPASTPEQFAERYEPIAGVPLELTDGEFGTELEEPDDDIDDDRFARYGTYTLTWTDDEDSRGIQLGDADPDSEGIYWTKVGNGWSSAKPFGPRLVLQWVGESTRRTTPKWDRLERAVRASFLGRPQLLPAAEQPCRVRGLDPLQGKPGSCSVDGIPVTFGDVGAPLRTPSMEAEVLGVETSDEIGEDAGVPTEAGGRLVEIAYRVRNTGDEPIPSLEMALRLGGETIDPSGLGAVQPASRSFPIPPGEEYETRVSFDVAPELAERARARGAFVFPAESDGERPVSDVAQGWIRLAQVPESLPEQPEPPRPPGAPPEPPTPEGPPDIAVEVGDGRPIGGNARGAFTASTYFPVPEDFERGGVRVGTRAGGCEVPSPTPRIKAGILAAERKLTPGQRFDAPEDYELLLADCGSEGTWAIASWRFRQPGTGLRVNGDEFVLRGGRWVGTPAGVTPGCRIPAAAAAAWQIDISICGSEFERFYQEQRRGQRP